MDLEVLLSARDCLVCEDLRSVLECLSGSVEFESSSEYYLKVSCSFDFFLSVFVLTTMGTFLQFRLYSLS